MEFSLSSITCMQICKLEKNCKLEKKTKTTSLQHKPTKQLIIKIYQESSYKQSLLCGNLLCPQMQMNELSLGLNFIQLLSKRRTDVRAPRPCSCSDALGWRAKCAAATRCSCSSPETHRSLGCPVSYSSVILYSGWLTRSYRLLQILPWIATFCFPKETPCLGHFAKFSKIGFLLLFLLQVVHVG